MQFHLRKIALLVTSLLAGSAAFAAASSSASITGFNFQLVDLDLNDGVTPSFQFLSAPGYSGYSLPNRISGQVQNNAGPYSSVTYQLSDLAPFSNLSKTENITGATVSSSVSSGGLSSSGSTTLAKTSYSAGSSVDANSSYASGIQLSANTALIITANGWVDASGLNNVDGPSGYYGTAESANATVSLQLSGVGASSNQSASSTLSASIAASTGYGQYVYDPIYGYYRWVYSTPDGSVLSQSKFGTLGVSFVNSTTAIQTVTFSASTSVSGYSASPTPEPGTIVLAAMGLGAAALVARRRRD